MDIPLELDASIVSLVKQGFATSFIGFSVATALYGISVLQVYLYYRNYATDRVMWKCVVALLFALDTLASIFAAHSLYTYFVLNFGKNPSEDLVIPWSFSVGSCIKIECFVLTLDPRQTEKLLVTLVTFLAQCFYANAIWKVTVSKTITSSITFLALVCLGLGIVTTVDIFTITGVTGVTGLTGTMRFSIISGFVQGLAALNDLLITAAMCYYLSHSRSGVPSTNQFVDTVILYTVSRGILTATTQILFLITNVGFPGNTYYMPFHMCVGKLYVNSVLATLNVRRSFHQKAEPQFDTGPAFSFFHPEGAEQSRSEPHRSNNNLNSAMDGADNPEEPKSSEKSDLKV